MKMAVFFKDRADWFFGASFFTLAYLLTLPWRPLFAPWEYFAADNFLASVPISFNVFLLRLPAAAGTLLAALAVNAAARSFNFKRPGTAAAFYLLLPPVFWLGTSISVIPLAVAAVSAALSAAFSCRIKALLRILLAAAAILAAAAAVKLDAKGIISATAAVMVLMPPLALFVIRRLEKNENSKERACTLFDRFIRLTSLLLITAAILITVPAILRHFDVSFPAEFELYSAAERIHRPVVALLVPLMWFHIARGSSDIYRKMIFSAVGISFILLILPFILPLKVLQNSVPSYALKKAVSEQKLHNTVCFADRECAPICRLHLPFEVRPIIPETLKAQIDETRKTGDAIIVFADKGVEKFRPYHAGTTYISGRYRIIKYPQEGKKK